MIQQVANASPQKFLSPGRASESGVRLGELRPSMRAELPLACTSAMSACSRTGADGEARKAETLRIAQ